MSITVLYQYYVAMRKMRVNKFDSMIYFKFTIKTPRAVQTHPAQATHSFEEMTTLVEKSILLDIQ